MKTYLFTLNFLVVDLKMFLHYRVVYKLLEIQIPNKTRMNRGRGHNRTLIV